MLARMYVVGIDENGLGPLLGPLVVTGAILELDGEYEPAALAAALAGGVRVDDSKAFMSHANPAAGERTALAFLDQLEEGRPPSADTLLQRLALPSPVSDRSCPAAARPLCHGPDLNLPCFGAQGDDAAAQAALAAASTELEGRLAAAGVRFVGAMCVTLCARDFNRLVEVRGGKMALDLALFEQVILAAHERLARREALYLCGKIGSRKAYCKVLSLLKRFPGRTLAEEAARSAYRAEGLGQVEFVRDGDALHPPTALASVIGKYVRELAMVRINRFLGEHLANSRPASGYRDPVTRALIERSAALRRELRIPEECFCRIR